MATNNRAEFTAAIRALQTTSGPIRILTDSMILLQAAASISQRTYAFPYFALATRPNADLVLALQETMKHRQVLWVKVKAHSGIEGNERADALAKVGARLLPQTTTT